MGAIASQITSVSSVYSTICSGVDQRKHWPVWGEFTGHRWIPPPPPPHTHTHKGPVTRKMFPFDDVIMICCEKPHSTVPPSTPSTGARSSTEHTSNPSNLYIYKHIYIYIYIYIRCPSLVITAPAKVLAPNGARPSACTVLIEKSVRHVFLQRSLVFDDSVNYGLVTSSKMAVEVLRIICSTSNVHDDVIKWKHFPRYWSFVWGIHRSPVNSPHKSQ